MADSEPVKQECIYSRNIQRHGGSKYVRLIRSADGQGDPIKVDVYCVLKAFNVTCPARQHAIKKLLCAGIRGKGSQVDDLKGVFDAMWRALEMQQQEESQQEQQEVVENG